MKRKDILGMLLRGIATSILIAGFASCAEDPADQDLFIGSYQGRITYSNPSEGKNITNDNGKVTIVKVGVKHDFHFSDNIPTIKGVRMEGNGGTFKGSISSDGAELISIKDGHLELNYIKGKLDEVWTANCDRK